MPSGNVFLRKKFLQALTSGQNTNFKKYPLRLVLDRNAILTSTVRYDKKLLYDFSFHSGGQVFQ